MNSWEDELIRIHHENIHREASIRQALKHSGIIHPSSIDRGITWLGDAMIQIGTRMKARVNNRLTVEEASAPTFLILL